MDGAVHAVIALDHRATQRPPVAGELSGFPLLVKDNIDVAGLPCTAGSPVLADLAPPADAPVVARLRAAGATVLGKANLSEWGWFRSRELPEGWSGVGGQTRNPHDPARSAWGSSAGSAVAVATGMARVALGTETDGSVVGPAGVVGVVGLKPETGLLPTRGIVPLAPSTDVPGVFARTLADAAACLDVMAGSAPAAVVPTELAGLRLGVWRVPGTPAEADAVLCAAVAALRARGAVPVPVDAGIAPEVSAAAARARLAEFTAALPHYLRSRGAAVSTVAELVEANRGDGAPQEVLEHAAALDEDELAFVADEGVRARWVARARLREVLRDNSVFAVLAATNPPAWRLADRDPVDLPAASTPAALAGAAAVSLPAGLVDGLPVGLSVFGPRAMADLLPLAFAVEAALGREVRLCP
ncbi:amidase family protein [Actinokineospora bangkokensis]|uniref:amidase family protein n=1 Tax=Actinokineospora bangkokensis TaxID=1193682 RepID=UPI0013016FF8|nr:amidase family protein [Actinokineospora bangkokensis]